MRYRRFMEITLTVGLVKCDSTNHRLNVDGEERFEGSQEGTVRDQIGALHLACGPRRARAPVLSTLWTEMHAIRGIYFSTLSILLPSKLLE
jgi:hypothetical protein